MPAPLPPLIVRADASARIGAGHLMRGLSLALEWLRRGGRASFVSDCDNPSWRKRVEDASCPMLAPSELAKAAQAGEKPWIFLDGYQFGAEREAASKLGKLLAVFDHGEPDGIRADAILNQNAGAERRYPHFAPGALALLGPRYALLRPEFSQDPPARRAGPAKKVLVSFGGSDPAGATAKAVAALKGLDVEAVVVLGAGNKDEAAVRRAAEGLKNARVERDADIRALMAWADCAVLAGGVTALEACAMGLPCVVLPIAENQIPGSKVLADAGAVVLASEDLSADVRRLVSSPELLAETSRRARAVCDGRGAARVASALLALSSDALSDSDLKVRSAEAGDVYDVWRLSNEPAVRANSFQKDPIPLETHLGWFERQLARRDARYWILEAGSALAAQVRYTREPDGSAEVHYSVRAAFAGKGLGTAALTRTAREACRELSASTLRGVVIMPNPASERAFEKAGYARAGEKEIQGRKCSVFEKPCS